MAPTPNKQIKVVVMCGGKGTRMWPISNISHPKQFESLLGKKSMFRQTIERLLTGFSATDIFIATSDKFASFLQEQAQEIPDSNFILEPAMRDNLGAVALAAAIIDHRHPDAVMVIIWGADHVVKDEQAFIKALKNASRLASANDVVVHVDTPASYPTVHNGWIKIGKQIDTIENQPVYEFIQQTEKPDQKTANKLFKDPQYLIHTGYMATKPSLLLSYYRRYAPAAYDIVHIIQQSIDSADYQRVLAAQYPRFEKVSVDYGLFEKLPPGSQWELPTDMGWIDVGTWELLYHGLDKDDHGNVIIGDANLIDTKRSLIVSQSDTPVGIIGMKDAIVVQTESGLLVCAMDQAPHVKTLYNLLFEKKLPKPGS